MQNTTRVFCHSRQFKKTSIRSREFIAKRAFGIWHFGHSVGASFARDPASDVASSSLLQEENRGSKALQQENQALN